MFKVFEGVVGDFLKLVEAAKAQKCSEANAAIKKAFETLNVLENNIKIDTG